MKTYVILLRDGADGFTWVATDEGGQIPKGFCYDIHAEAPPYSAVQALQQLHPEVTASRTTSKYVTGAGWTGDQPLTCVVAWLAEGGYAPTFVVWRRIDEFSSTGHLPIGDEMRAFVPAWAFRALLMQPYIDRPKHGPDDAPANDAPLSQDAGAVLLAFWSSLKPEVQRAYMGKTARRVARDIIGPLMEPLAKDVVREAVASEMARLERDGPSLKARLETALTQLVAGEVKLQVAGIRSMVGSKVASILERLEVTAQLIDKGQPRSVTPPAGATFVERKPELPLTGDEYQLMQQLLARSLTGAEDALRLDEKYTLESLLARHATYLRQRRLGTVNG